MGAYSITRECIGCSACARQCPVGAISGAPKERHVIDENACVRCGLCGRVCPAKAVVTDKGLPTRRVPKRAWKHPVFNEDCVGCSLCVINCPKRCLDIEAPHHHGDVFTRATLARPDDCIGCGLCVDACPIEAVRLQAPEDTRSAQEQRSNP